MMNDQQIEAFIERIKPDLKVAMKSLLSGKTVHMFDFAEGTNSAGVRQKVVLFLANEPTAAILEGTVKGLDEAGRIITEQLQL